MRKPGEVIKVLIEQALNHHPMEHVHKEMKEMKEPFDWEQRVEQGIHIPDNGVEVLQAYEKFGRQMIQEVVRANMNEVNNIDEVLQQIARIAPLAMVPVEEKKQPKKPGN